MPALSAAPTLATHYERIAFERQHKVGRSLVATMAVSRGQRVLELGCGLGLLTEHLADQVGHAGDVLGLDPLPLRVQIAHQHRARRNLRFQIGDVAQLTRFPVACFDVIVANGVLHTWRDARAALAEAWRLLAPGGRLGLTTLSADHPHPAAAAQAAVLAEPPFVMHPLPEEAREYPLSPPALGEALDAVGFAPINIETRRELTRYPHAEAAIESMQATTWGRFLGHLPVYLRAPARAEIVQRLASRCGPDGLVHESVAITVVAHRAAVTAQAL